jgi:hypothetical protein
MPKEIHGKIFETFKAYTTSTTGLDCHREK